MHDPGLFVFFGRAKAIRVKRQQLESAQILGGYSTTVDTVNDAAHVLNSG